MSACHAKDGVSFVEAITIAVIVYWALGFMLQIPAYWDLTLDDLPFIPTTFYLILSPVFSIAAGFVFLRSRAMAPRRSLLLGLLFVPTCIGIWVVWVLARLWILGGKP